MRVLIADDNPSSLELLTTVLRTRTAHEVVAVSNGAQALEQALSQPFDVLLLDWLMPALNGTQVCRLIRAKPAIAQPYVVFVTARGRREEILECLAAGADDLLTKPVAPDLLVARLELAKHRGGGAAPTALQVRNALGAAAAEGDGELAVRSGKVVARVFFHGGQIAWAHLADGSETLLDVLATEAGIDAETSRAAVEESKRTGAPLTDTLAAWGLVDRARVRECVRIWTRKKLDAILSLPQPQLLFLPHKRSYAEDLLFRLDELLDPPVKKESSPRLQAVAAEKRPSLIPGRGWAEAFVAAPETPPEIEHTLDACMRCEGLVGVAALDHVSGQCLGRRGAELSADVAWAHIHCLNAVMRQEAVEDLIVTTGRYFHLARLVKARPGTLVYAVVDASQTLLATARMDLERAIADHTGE